MDPLSKTDPRPTDQPDTDLVRRLAASALDHIVDPPRGDDPVVRFASPEELMMAFSSSVGLALGEHAPAHDTDAVEAAAQTVLHHSVHTTHPRFLNQNFAGADPVAVVGDWLAAALNTANSTFEIAPVFHLLESALLAKLAHLAGFPSPGPDESPTNLPPGMFCPGGSVALLYSLQLARHRLQPDLVRFGASGQPLSVFVSKSGHYGAGKAAAMLGIGTDAVVEVATDHDGSMDPNALRDAMATEVAEGRTPLAVIATAGTTVTCAFDPLNEVADACVEHGAWFHIDGCYGASALFSTDHRHRLAGSHRADSMVWNLHKMMGVTQQCTALLLREPERLDSCFSSGAEYLFQPDKQFGEWDSGDRTYQCGRRVDALKLWLTWKTRGDDGFAARIDHAVAMADFARMVIGTSDGAFVPVVDTGFTNVVFLWVPPELRPLDLEYLFSEWSEGRSGAVWDRLHRLAPRIKARMQVEGTALIGYQPIHGVNTFRLLFMNPAVGPDDVDAVLGHIARYGAEEWAALD